MPALSHRTRRSFLAQSALAAAGASLFPRLAFSADGAPHVQFPADPRERVAIASYPFRDFILGPRDGAALQKMDLKDFAAHCGERFNIRKVEPWNRHFRSTDAKYLEEFRASVHNARGAVVNIAVDGDHSLYAADASERDQAVAFSKKWIDVAVAIGSPSVRTNIAEAKDSKPDLDRAADSLKRVAEFAATKKTGREEYAYKGIAAMFQHAYGICHVKDMENNEKGQVFRVDMPRTFGILKRANYRGYCSMEFDALAREHHSGRDPCG